VSQQSLDFLAAKYGTDKGVRPVSSGLTPKGYTPVYEAFFAGLEIKRLLELGVAGGASIRMWAEWLPRAMIVGVDKDLRPGISMPNVRLYRGRQEDRELLESISRAYGPWDVVIDDGSHRAFDQLASLEHLLPYVRDGGYYAIEDLHARDSATAEDLAAAVSSKATLIVSTARLALIRKVVTVAPKRSAEQRPVTSPQ
jgi:hypothetical protein